MRLYFVGDSIGVRGVDGNGKLFFEGGVGNMNFGTVLRADDGVRASVMGF